jgi:hypothetical protein
LPWTAARWASTARRSGAGRRGRHTSSACAGRFPLSCRFCGPPGGASPDRPGLPARQAGALLCMLDVYKL